MGGKGRAKVADRYTWDRIAGQTRALYGQLIAESKRATHRPLSPAGGADKGEGAKEHRSYSGFAKVDTSSGGVGDRAVVSETQRSGGGGSPMVSVVIVCTNDREHLAECLGSLRSSSYQDIEVIVADNGSTDGSVEFIRRTFPSVRVIELGKNLGFPGANNRGLRAARGTYLFELNPDTRIDPRCIEELVSVMEDDGRIGAAAAKMKIFFEPQVLNSVGIAANKILYGWDRGAFELDRGQYDQVSEVIAGCGGALMLRRSLVERIGEMDGRFFMYYEDLDFGIRAWLSGASIVFVPQAVVYHKYKAGIRRAIYNEYYDHRNRLRMMLKNFSLSTLSWMVPASLKLTFATMAKYVAAGRHRDALFQLRALLWNLAVLPNTLRERRKVQRLRAVPDAAVLDLLDEGMGYPRLSSAVPSHRVVY
jgi:GT2 family glycosyltransferase